MSAKPSGYHLPWCDALNMPYWQINMTLCYLRKGWREHQSGRAMAEIIPEIDALIAAHPPAPQPKAHPHREQGRDTTEQEDGRHG